MGIAFALKNNDWYFDGVGKPERVSGRDKLKRDLIKFFATKKRGAYGQEIDERIGTKIKSKQSQLAETKRVVVDTLKRFVE